MKKILLYIMILVCISIMVGCGGGPPNNMPQGINVSMVNEDFFAGWLNVDVSSVYDSTIIYKTEIFLDEILVSTDTTEPFGHKFFVSTYSEGLHTIHVIASTSVGELKKDLDINIRYFLPNVEIRVYPDTSEYVEVNIGDGRNQETTLTINTNVNIAVNGVALTWDNVKYRFISTNGTININPGQEVTCQITHPEITQITESMVVPDEPSNFRIVSGNLDNLINIPNSTVSLAWDQPLTGPGVYRMEIAEYNASNSYIATIHLDFYEGKTSYNLTKSFFNSSTKYIEVSIGTYKSQLTGCYYSDDGHYRSYFAVQSKALEVISNRP